MFQKGYRIKKITQTFELFEAAASLALQNASQNKINKNKKNV